MAHLPPFYLLNLFVYFEQEKPKLRRRIVAAYHELRNPKLENSSRRRIRCLEETLSEIITDERELRAAIDDARNNFNAADQLVGNLCYKYRHYLPLPDTTWLNFEREN